MRLYTFRYLAMDKRIYISKCVISICYIVLALSTAAESEINVATIHNGGTCTTSFTGPNADSYRLIDGIAFGSSKWSTTEIVTRKWINLQFNDTFYLTKIVFEHPYYADERNMKDVLLAYADGASTAIVLTNRVDGYPQNDTSKIGLVSNFVNITILSAYDADQTYTAMYEIQVFGVEVTTSTTRTTTTTTSLTTASTTTSPTTTTAITSISSSTSTTNTPITEITTPSTHPSSPPTVPVKPTTQTTSLPKNDPAFTNDNQDQNVSSDNIKPISIGVISFLIAIIVILALTSTFVFIKQRRKISSLNDQLNGKAVYENDPTRNVQPSTYEDVGTVSKYEATGGPTEYERMEHIHPSQRPLPGIYADLK